ncbi:helix-hairpin-helix domain-containing protein [Jhaorihella thermophila]
MDPGIRTGIKAAVVDATGKVVATDTLYPFQPKNDLRGAQASVLRLIAAHGVELIAIGNGTASRETERFVAETLKMLPEGAGKPVKVVVSEAGASVYSASELAARELPDLDVSLRGAVSIARRLQDPLAELVKIEPKSIGVGQYQHDVDQHRLGRALEAVVEDAVNAVGVDLNTASAALLSHVSGLGPGLAEAIVAHRDANGAFRSRRQLLEVPRLGPKAFEQCAGFLRIRDGEEPLDASSVHPEAYGVARRIVAACGRDIRSLMGDSAALKRLDPRDFVDSRFGLPTVRDILAELEKPGRDPRPSFRTAAFAEGIEEITDLKPGMVLEGTVTNVAAFGAFVDIGVHQDGLVHVSQLADRFVKDPHEVVKAGDVVRVTVVEVDVARRRIGLSMKKDGGASARAARAERDGGQPRVAGRGPGGPGRETKAAVRARWGGGAEGCNAASVKGRHPPGGCGCSPDGAVFGGTSCGEQPLTKGGKAPWDDARPGPCLVFVKLPGRSGRGGAEICSEIINCSDRRRSCFGAPTGKKSALTPRRKRAVVRIRRAIAAVNDAGKLGKIWTIVQIFRLVTGVQCRM